MTLTLNIFAALLVALGLSIGFFLVGAQHEARASKALASAEAALGTVRDPSAREAISGNAATWERSLAPICRLLSRRTASVEKALVRSAALRITISQRLIPLGLFLLTLGVMAGLLRRNQGRDLVLYSSLTFSYIGKFLALSALAYGVFVAISPFAPPLWTLYPALGTAALGAALYVGNLPPKL